MSFPRDLRSPVIVNRQGFTLLLVAGFTALIISMALVFVLRARLDTEESQAVLNRAQARIMLYAGCAYILEAGRIGWDVRSDHNGDGHDDFHEETYGWIDVRDGLLGPKWEAYPPADWMRFDTDGSGNLEGAEWESAVRDPGLYRLPNPGLNNPDNPAHYDYMRRQVWFPIGHHARYPMAVRMRPPHAIAQVASPNAIQADNPSAADFGMPYLRHPDPWPATGTIPTDSYIARAEAGTLSPQDYSDAFDSNSAPSLDAARQRPETMNLGWFRVYRDGPDTFIVACGSGPTGGLKDYAEMITELQEQHGVNPATAAQYAFDQYGVTNAAEFDRLAAREARLWFRVAWSPAIGHIQPTVLTSHALDQRWLGMEGPVVGGFNWNPGIAMGDWNRWIEFIRSPYGGRTNAAGTIAWIQRLSVPPPHW